MRIDNVQQVASIYTKDTKVSHVEATNKVSQAQDNIKISETGKDYAFAQRVLKDVPDVRQDKIDAIRSRMENDEYSVSSEDIVDKLFSSEV